MKETRDESLDESLSSEDVAAAVVGLLKLLLAPVYLGLAAAVAVWVFRGCLGALEGQP